MFLAINRGFASLQINTMMSQLFFGSGLWLPQIIGRFVSFCRYLPMYKFSVYPIYLFQNCVCAMPCVVWHRKCIIAAFSLPTLRFHWVDQGWGNHKGTLALVREGGTLGPGRPSIEPLASCLLPLVHFGKLALRVPTHPFIYPSWITGAMEHAADFAPAGGRRSKKWRWCPWVMTANEGQSPLGLGRGGALSQGLTFYSGRGFEVAEGGFIEWWGVLVKLGK